MSAKIPAQMKTAAFAITYALDRLEVDYGFFGAYAFTVLGSSRILTESDRISCAIACTKPYLVAHLKNFARFALAHDSDERPDIATYVFDSSQLRIDFYPRERRSSVEQKSCLALTKCECSVHDLGHHSETVCSRSSVEGKPGEEERSHTLANLSVQSAARTGV
jgi:hypothetical protein